MNHYGIFNLVVTTIFSENARLCGQDKKILPAAWTNQITSFTESSPVHALRKKIKCLQTETPTRSQQQTMDDWAEKDRQTELSRHSGERMKNLQQGEKRRDQVSASQNLWTHLGPEKITLHAQCSLPKIRFVTILKVKRWEPSKH